MNRTLDFDRIRNLAIGNVEFVSPKEIKVLLDLNAPQSTAINTGVPLLFPKINGFILIPNETGALVGIISWMGVEYSQYPKRKGFKEFDVVDLPYPLRKLSVSPLGTLKLSKDGYDLERGIFSFPSVGDTVIMPTQEQLQAIIENKDDKARVAIGTSPLVPSAVIRVDPDKLFGRHLAILGNTGSGKSCSVAGVIRWSVEAARTARKSNNKEGDVNARFIVLDPNGEYSETFGDLGSNVRKFRVKLDESNDGFKQLRVPAWMWNSYEWSSVSLASGRSQRPLLRRALRELRGECCSGSDAIKTELRNFYSSYLIELRNDIKEIKFKTKPSEFGRKLHGLSKDAQHDVIKLPTGDPIKGQLAALASITNDIADSTFDSFIKNGTKIEYYKEFQKSQVEAAITCTEALLESLGGCQTYTGPDEDCPIPFKDENLPNHLERLAKEDNVTQYLDFLVMRIRTLLSDSRLATVIGTNPEISLVEWLENYIGQDSAKNGLITIVDLSLVPVDVIHLVVAVIARICFEALQRYRRLNKKVLPTVLVMEEAHSFIRKSNENEDNISPDKMCCHVFEKIAREGRKFGLGLTLSSQRPSELSSTVLSQCNTFLLHRIVNDKDQELVRKLVPDNLGSFLDELPMLPTRKAILLGWATPLPVLVDIKALEEKHRPDSQDPDFWDVWTGKSERNINWNNIVDDWQK